MSLRRSRSQLETRLENELVDHLLASRNEFRSYKRSGNWQDRPDRLLECDSKPPLGIELSELCPLSGIGDSQLRRASGNWDYVYQKCCELRVRHPELREVSIVFRGVRSVHRKNQNNELAKEIIGLMLTGLGQMGSRGLVEVHSCGLLQFPLLASIVETATMFRSREPVWFSPYDINLSERRRADCRCIKRTSNGIAA